MSDPYFDQARHRYSYAHNNPATFTDPTGYWVPPAWLCGLFVNAGYLSVGSLQFSFGSYSAMGGGPMSWPQVRATLPDVTPDSYRSAAPTGLTFSGPGYAGGDVVARALIDHGVDAWLQENGDAAINVSLGVSYAALTLATYGMAAEAGVFAGMSARVASFGATSWRAITGVAGVVGEGARRYGNQVTRWGAQVMRADRGAGTAASSAASGGPRVTVASGGGAAQDGLTLVRTLERGEGWMAIQDEMRYLQWSTKQEHYLISFKNGAVRLFSGGEFRTTFEFTSDMRRLLMHTHPKVTDLPALTSPLLGFSGSEAPGFLSLECHCSDFATSNRRD